jgi:hypothetical protein
VSHPIQLHPADSLERVLDDMRQSVVAHGDDGWVNRVLMAGIWTALLSLLDTLIGLLADFRAGKLPPVLPARDRSAIPTDRERADQRTTPGPRAATDPAAASPEDSAPRPVLRNRGKGPCPAPADHPEKAATGQPDPAPRRSASPLSAPPLAIRRTENPPRRAALHPSHVPRWPRAEFGMREAPTTHVPFVTYS